VIEKLWKKGMKVPKLLKVNQEDYSIEMEYIDGVKLKDYINDPALSEEGLKEILIQMGEIVLQVHEVGIIHGDLTTSNMIIKDKLIYLIDFGLSYFKESAEDRAVDLYVLERAFKSTHPQFETKFDELLISYGNEAALKKL
jgi:TP53 regulating kinase-like protein